MTSSTLNTSSRAPSTPSPPLTDDERLLERRPGDVVPRRPAGDVDRPLVGPEQRRLRLRLARRPFPWRQGRGQGADARDPLGEAVEGVVSAPTGREHNTGQDTQMLESP